MDFRFFIISTILVSTFTGIMFAQTVSGERQFTLEEIDEMASKGVIITMPDGTFLIQLYPEDAPNTVHNFLTLVESGYYDGVVFHRIIPGFMIQTGDPNTKNPDFDPGSWGTGGPGYNIKAEFNTLQHDRGIVSMARSAHPDSGGSQFFIVHRDSNFLDGEYTAFGRLVPGTHSLVTLDSIVGLERGPGDVPVDVEAARIEKAEVIDFTASGFGEPDRNISVVREERQLTVYDDPQTPVHGDLDVYYNQLHEISFALPYRWEVVSENVDQNLDLVIEPTMMEHNVQAAIKQSGFIPQVLVTAEPREPEMGITEVNTAFFSIARGEEPKILSNYVFEADDGRKGHVMVTTQNVSYPEGVFQFKAAQIHFNNMDTNYSIIYVNTTEFFRYELNAFKQVLDIFRIIVDGESRVIEFRDHPVLLQVLKDAAKKPEPEPEPPARIGGCLIATASFGSELAPQVQLLREIRDNTVLQTQSGLTFINAFNQFYYSFSPTIADYERESPIFKEAVKLTLTPLLASLTLLQYVDIDSEHEMLGYGIGVIMLNVGMYFIAPAVLIMKIRSFYKLQ